MHHNDEINLLDCWRVLVKRKRLIGFVMGGGFVASLIISFLLPKIYASATSILPPQQENSLAAGMAASQLAGGFGGFSGGFLGLSSPTDLWVGILKSQTVQDAIINRFDLMNVFEAKAIEDARKALNRMTEITKSKEDIISIRIEDENPQRAARIANAFVEELDKVNKNAVMSAGGRMRVFVEKRLNEAKMELERIEETVKAFQEKNGAVKLDDQSKAIIEAIGRIKGNLMAKEVELQTFLSFATPNNPQAEILKSQVEELRGSLRELEEGKKGDLPSSRGIFIPTARMPDLGLQYARLLRDIKVQETLYGLLTQQYEMARIQEAKDSPTVQVLDVAKIPQKKAKPNRAIFVILCTFTAAFGAVFLSLLMEKLKELKLEMENIEGGRIEKRPAPLQVVE